MHKLCIKYVQEPVNVASSRTREQETGGIERINSFLSLLNVTYLNFLKRNIGMYLSNNAFLFAQLIMIFDLLACKRNNEKRSQESVKALVVSA